MDCMVSFPSAMTIREKTQLMSASEIERTLVRLAHEIVEKNPALDRLVLIGIRRRGVPLAQRLAHNISQIQPHPVPVGILDITFYRDDLSTVGNKPVHTATEIPFSITDKDVILCDDVLYTGRTTRAAINVLFDFGRPARIMLAALVDRGGRELPVAADFVATTVALEGRQSLALARAVDGHLTLTIETDHA